MARPLPYRMTPASDHSVLISFGEEISLQYHQWVRVLTECLLKQSSKAIVNIHPAYSSLLITFDPLRATFQEIESSVRNFLVDTTTELPASPRRIEIPVCYDEAFGPDLSDVASLNILSTEEVIRIHSDGEYYVSFIGFTPGFPYLSGMSPRIATPRLATPRKRVPAGSVAIGGNQTGIYPTATPGGWRIIGRTPLRLFVSDRDPPSLLALGGKVRFRRISRAEFDEICPP